MDERDESPSYEDLQAAYREFRAERDWDKFHDPKSVLLALVGEVGELAELLQWIPADQAKSHFASGVANRRVAEELADVLLYLTGLADAVGVDIIEAAHDKLRDARARFPVEKVRGIAPLKQ